MLAALRGGLLLATLDSVRHVLFVLLVALYVVVIGQNWAVYTATVLVTLWVKSRGRLSSVPFTIG